MRAYQKIFGVLMAWDCLRFLWAAAWVDFWLRCGVSGTQLAHLKSWTASICVVLLWLLPHWQQQRRRLFLLGLIGTAGQFSCMLLAHHTHATVWLYASEACNATALAAVQCVGHAYLIDTYQRESGNQSTQRLLLWESRCGLMSALAGLCVGTWAYAHSTTGLLQASCLLAIVVCAVAVCLLPADRQRKKPPPIVNWRSAQHAAVQPLKTQLSCVLLWLGGAVALQMAVHCWPWLLFQASDRQRGLGWTALSAAAQLLAQGLGSIAWGWARGQHHIKICLSGLVVMLGLLLWCWRQHWLLGCIVWVALLTLLAARIMLRCQMQLHDALVEEQRVAVEATLGCAHRLLMVLLLAGFSVVNAV